MSTKNLPSPPSPRQPMTRFEVNWRQCSATGERYRHDVNVVVDATDEASARKLAGAPAEAEVEALMFLALWRVRNVEVWAEDGIDAELVSGLDGVRDDEVELVESFEHLNQEREREVCALRSPDEHAEALLVGQALLEPGSTVSARELGRRLGLRSAPADVARDAARFWVNWGAAVDENALAEALRGRLRQ